MQPNATLANDDAVLRRVQGEFLEMPGLRLSEPQARRLWGLDPTVCATLLNTLVESNFLFKTSDGFFMRIERALPVKVTNIRARPIAAA